MLASTDTARPGDDMPSKKKLTKRTTEEGKTYESYTYVGGEEKGSLPLNERVKLLHFMLEGPLSRVDAVSQFQ